MCKISSFSFFLFFLLVYRRKENRNQRMGLGPASVGDFKSFIYYKFNQKGTSNL